MNYTAFLQSKQQSGGGEGITDPDLPAFLFDFQRDLVEWALRHGRAAIFADCGLGKGPMALVWADQIARQTNGRVLILTPLAVGAQLAREAEKFGVEATRVRDGKIPPGANLIITNYEQLHRFDPHDFTGAVCDESSILKNFDGKTKAAVTEFLRTLPYRLLCTATAAPNDWIELGTSSEALGHLGHVDMLGRFFVNDQNAVKTNRNWSGSLWRLRGHAVDPFWRWVTSWARALRRPSDLGYDDTRFVLPKLTEREHVVKSRTVREGFLFEVPAVGLAEEREERRRTIPERCEKVAELVEGHDYSMIWCHLNGEGDLLEQLIPRSIQIAGRHSEDYKEAAAEWFMGQRCLCSDPLFTAKLATWRNDPQATGATTTDPTESGGLKRPSNTDANTGTSVASTSSGTTAPIKKSGGGRRPNARRGESERASDTRTTPSIASSGSSGRKNTGSVGPTSGSRRDSGDTDSRSQTTGPSRGGGAPSAGRSSRPVQDTDISTLTTATTRGDSADCSARSATSGSGSSGTPSTSLIERPCICGYASKHPRRLIAKPKMFGFGLNLQHCAHVVTFATHSYEQHYQGVRRCWRFGQTRPVVVDVVATEAEQAIRENLQRKQAQADEMFSQLVSMMGDAIKVERTAYGSTPERIPGWLRANV